MVDRDKIRSRMKKDDDSSTPKKRKKSKGKSKSKSVNTSSEAKEETMEDKLEQFKTNTSSTSSSKTVDRKIAKGALECLGNIVLYCEGALRDKEDPDTKKERYQRDVLQDVYDEFARIISRRNIQAICERYNIDWETDILENIVKNQGDVFEDMIEREGSKTGNVSVGSGSDFKREHYHEVLLAIGEMFLFTEVLKDKFTGGDAPEIRMAEGAINDLVSTCIEFTGLFRLEEAAKENGISWQQDIISKIGK